MTGQRRRDDVSERVEPTRGLRADASRNIKAILDAAERLLTSDASASMAAIAAEAGVGRVTVYAHFSNRAELVDAVMARAIGEAESELRQITTTGDPYDALCRLVTASWRIVERNRWMLAAAQGEISDKVIRAHHERLLRRLGSLIGRGQRLGQFRDDLPRHWLVTVGYSLMHAIAEEVSQGRVRLEDAPSLIVSTYLSALDAKPLGVEGTA